MVRGNVMGSRGSVIPFLKSKESGTLPITDPIMTRFMISLEDAVGLVWFAFSDMVGGEIYVKKIPSIKVTDLASAVATEASQKIIGIRAGEKLHEQMIGAEDAASTYSYPGYYTILPVINGWGNDPARIKDGLKVQADFTYDSDTNEEWMSKEELQKWLRKTKRVVTPYEKDL